MKEILITEIWDSVDGEGVNLIKVSYPDDVNIKQYIEYASDFFSEFFETGEVHRAYEDFFGKEYLDNFDKEFYGNKCWIDLDDVLTAIEDTHQGISHDYVPHEVYNCDFRKFLY